MLSIWHVKNTEEARERKLSFEFGEGDAPRFPEDYTLVARIESSSDLDEGYRLTNHIDRPWFQNAAVEVLQHSRSTSMGDVLVVDHEEAFRVVRAGFETIEKGPHLRLAD